jgi:tetratricopeptide (TPR) repeat protein
MFEEITQKYPMEKEAHYFLGRYYETKRNYEEAIKEYQVILEMDPFHSFTHARIVDIAQTKGDYESALKWAERYVSACPDEPNPYFKLGRLYFNKGQLDQAIIQFQKALDVKPDFRDALYYVGLMYAFREDYPEAIKWAEEDIVQATAPTDKADAYLLKAFYEYWRGAFQKALDDADKALILKEGTGNLSIPSFSYVLKGFAYLGRREYSLSRESFTQAEKFNTQNRLGQAAIYKSNREYFLGSIDIQEGKTDEARKRLAAITSLLSEAENARQENRIENQKQALHGELLIAEGFSDEAISILNQLPANVILVEGVGTAANMWGWKSIKLDIYQPEIVIAHAYAQKGDTDLAIGLLEKRTILTPPSKFWQPIPPKVYYNLGWLHEKKGMEEKAREYYAKFLELWKNADPGLPEVEDAKAKMAALTN